MTTSDPDAARRYGRRWTERSYGEPWQEWLYGRHPPEELHAWARRLRLFRYCRAAGGHANDGDDLRLALRAETDSALLAVCDALGIAPVRRWGHVHLAGQKVFALAGPGRLELHLSDPDSPFEVTGRAVAMAAAIEPALAPVRALVIDPPLDNPHCVSPKYYPDIWPGG